MKFPQIRINRADYENDVASLSIRCYTEILRFAGKCEARKYQDSVIRITDFKQLVIKSCEWVNIVNEPK